MRNFFKNPYGELSESSRNYTLPRGARILKSGSFLLAVFFLVASFFPTWFFWNPELTGGLSGRDIIAIVDVSESMGATDGRAGKLQSRLDTAKEFLSFLTKKNPWNRYALIGFENEAKTLFPLSGDIPSFSSAVSALKPRMLTEHGSNISAGLTEASGTIPLANDPIILLFSDSSEGNLIAPKNISSFSPIVYGIGSEAWARIPKGADLFGNIIYRKYQGEDVIVRLDSEGLKKITTALSGKYVYLENPEDAYRKSFAGIGEASWKAAFPLYLVASFFALVCIGVPLKRKI